MLSLRRRWNKLGSTGKVLTVLVAVGLACGGYAALSGAWKLAGLLPLALAARYRRSALGAPEVPRIEEAHAEDAASDETARLEAETARETASKEAGSGWIRSAHRKRPRIGGLLAAFALGPLAVRAEPVPAPPSAGAELEVCIPATGIRGAGEGWGTWYEGSTLYYCPCPSRLEDATRLPGGCRLPEPGIGYTVPENADMWGDLEAAGVYVGKLREELARARTERDQALADWQATAADVETLGKLNERLLTMHTEAGEVHSGLWYGAGIGSGIVLTLLIVWAVQ